MSEPQSEDPQVCGVPIPKDGHIYRHFKLVTNGADRTLDALSICYEVLAELEDGADAEANLRYLLIPRRQHDLKEQSYRTAGRVAARAPLP